MKSKMSLNIYTYLNLSRLKMRIFISKNFQAFKNILWFLCIAFCLYEFRNKVTGVGKKRHFNSFFGNRLRFNGNLIPETNVK